MTLRDPSCEDDFDFDSLPIDTALKLILDAIQPIRATERVHVRAALGRVLAHDIKSPVNVPQHTNSAMDGYAVRHADLNPDDRNKLQLVGSSFAGRPFEGVVPDAAAVRIMTGAAMPAGTDTVVMQEHTEVDNNTVHLDGQHKLGQNVRAAGEDIKTGDTVLSAGHELGPAELGLIASLGLGEVDVKRRVRVAYFSTGDELRSIGETLGPGEIYDSNRYTLYAMLTRAGVDVVDLGVVRDKPEDVEAALQSAAEQADIVITSGGVSVGEADYIKQVLEKIGQVGFWKVAMKPGRPLAVGQIGEARFFGLPGNPVSVMVTFYQFVAPAIRRLAGTSQTTPLVMTARTTEALKKRPGRLELQRGILALGADGTLEVRATGDQGSGILHSMSVADCFIVLPLECSRVAAGDSVTVQPFMGLI